MTSRYVLLALATVSVSASYVARVSRPGADMSVASNGWRPEPASTPRLLACSTSFSQINPCAPSASSKVNTTSTYTFTLTNKIRFESQVFNLSCAVSGVITSCSTPSALVVAANSSKSFTLSYLTSGTTGIGSITVTASDFDEVNTTLTVTVTDPPPPPPTPFQLVDVTPDYQEADVGPNVTGSSSFVVRNQGSAGETYVIAKSCTGAGVSCTPSTREITIAAGATSTETVAFTAGGTLGNTGVVQLVASQKSNTAVRDSGLVAVTVASKTPGLEIAALNPGSTVDRDLCLTIAGGSDAAVQCGDLRIVHGLPATRTRNATRRPVLIYSSQQAHPYPLIAAELTVTSDSVPQTVTARILIGGAEYAYGTWSGGDWSGGGTRRITLGFDGQSFTTGIYTYQLEVTRQYAGGATRTHVQSGELLVVNRMDSHFGGGWWLAGLEQLVVGSNLLWIGADGSARKYTPHASLANVWVAAPLDRPDSITYDPSRQIYTRWLPRKLRLDFNAVGQQVATINRLGDTTRFWYGAAGRLDSLTIPPSGAGKTYRFGYDAHYSDYRLSSVTAPPAGAAPRVVTLTVPVNSSIVTAITDPDGRVVSFAYDASFARRIAARTDRRGSVTTYTFGSASKVTAVSLDMGGGTFITTSFVPAETRGLAGTAALAAPLAYTKVDGPRADVGDSTLFWPDRFGAPARIRDAVGNETVITRADPRWPAVVTRLRRPNGQILAATYDSLGNLTSTSDSSTWRDSSGTRRYATTTYEWDAPCSHVTRIRQPEGPETRSGYHASTCNPAWLKSGRDSVEFFYFTSGVKQGLLSSTLSHGAGATEAIDYDATLGNLQSTTSPLGSATTYFADGLGRDTLIRSPVDAAGMQFLYQRLAYDIVDQVVLDSTYATTGGQSLLVRKSYDAEGNLDTLKQLSIPDPNAIGWLVHIFQYDRANRMTLDSVPSFNWITWTYDPAGNLITGGRRPAQNSYDALNRLITSIAGADTALFYYNAGGQVIGANNSSARVSRTYHVNGTLATDTLRIKNVNYQLFNDHVYGLRFGYDLNGRRAWMKHPSQLTPLVGGVRADSVAYAYDPLTGAIAAIRDGFGHRYESTYDNANRVSTLTRRLTTGDAIVETRRYDLESRLVRRIQQAPAALLLHDDSLRYDGRGKVTQNVLTGDTVAYSPLGHVTHSSFNSAGESFTVDALGNRVSGVQVAEQWVPSSYKYQPGSGRQLDIIHDMPGTLDDTTFQSNASGELTLQAKKHYWTVDCGPGCKDTLREERRTRHSYTARGQLSATVYNFDSIPAPRTLYKAYRSEEQFRYDALGRRVWRRIIRGSNCQTQDPSSGCQSAVDRFVWDGNEILHEIRAAGDSTATDAAMESDDNALGYVHGTGIDEPLTIFKGTTVVLPYTNWRGLFDRGTCPATACVYEPEFPAANAGTFGAGSYDSDGPSSWWGSLIEHGQDAHGFQYRRNRYYDPKTGRFTQEDPIGLAGGLNLYGFANGDPINFSDPFGLCPVPPESCPGRSGALVMLGQVAPSINREVATFLPRNLIAAATGIGVGALLNKAAGLVSRVAGSLSSKTATQTVNSGDEVFRVWGGGSSANGPSWTTVNPGSVQNFRAAAGLPTQNAGRFVSEGVLTSSEGVSIRASLPGAGGRGGLLEVVIPDAATQVRLTRVSGVNPPF